MSPAPTPTRPRRSLRVTVVVGHRTYSNAKVRKRLEKMFTGLVDTPDGRIIYFDVTTPEGVVRFLCNSAQELMARTERLSSPNREITEVAESLWGDIRRALRWYSPDLKSMTIVEIPTDEVLLRGSETRAKRPWGEQSPYVATALAGAGITLSGGAPLEVEIPAIAAGVVAVGILVLRPKRTISWKSNL
jgi:hypothetical protein